MTTAKPAVQTRAPITPRAAEPPPHPKVPMAIIMGAIHAERTYRVPASVTLAQWALESGWGKSVSGKNNYGGITAKVKGAVFPFQPGKPQEPATLCWTHEVVAGKRVKCQRWFKDYATPADYFAAHAKLLGTSPIYAEARSKYPDANAFADALDPEYKPRAKDPKWRAYATDPKYAETLKSIMKSNDFYRYNGWAA
jgi:flagellum-specific peptidoglycan hydrolase FlgJ